MKKEVKIPDIAESVESGVITSVLVSKGDHVKVDQPLVEIETEKASTDIPSPYEGVVDEVKVKEGDEVKVNQVIMIIETEGGEAEPDKDTDRQKPGKEKKETGLDKTEDVDRQDKNEEQEEENKQEDKKGSDQKKEEKAAEKKKHHSLVAAAPSVRRLARELEVDLAEINGSGPGDRITAEDVKKHAEKPSQVSEKEEQAEVKLPDFSKLGPVSHEKINTVRRITAETVTRSWLSIPHVTQFDEADITNLETFRKQSQPAFEKNGIKLTVTALLVKIAGYALQKFPRFNASFNNDEIILKHYYHIGVAVDTPQGLLVPVIRDVNTKTLLELASELEELAGKAREKKISPDEMQGGNFTVSNLGGIGGTAFTPIILPPQVAILGVSGAKFKPVYYDEELQRRMILPLSLSYDHRVIDGADGARFLRWICDVMEDPYALLR